jgi:hypothetical protein
VVSVVEVAGDFTCMPPVMRFWVWGGKKPG